MIRAGRRELALTVADMARLAGMSLSHYRKTKPYTKPGHPAPISSSGAARLMWDREQVEAYHAGEPVPSLPPASDQDLLDRHEAAALVGVTPRSWNLYKHEAELAKHAVKVPQDGGVEHWPRHVLQRFKDSRPGNGPAAGRPRGSGDMIPRDQVLPRIAELLDADPAATVTDVSNALGIARFPTARDGLNKLRGQRIADLVEANPHLDTTEAAERLGYPRITHRGATAAADAELRARAAHPYLAKTADALVEAGLAEASEIPVRTVDGDHLTAAIPLSPGQPSAALVWDDRYGWRTANNRRHPIGKHTSTPPQGDDIRYLGTSIHPEPAELITDLADASRGTNKPAH
ncbi:DUF6292 family protein [Streptomyces diastaticus]|uniref:DUF6292 domain-containing protein n=3 Tax=Streptomyces diastaticus TaxID=1956 RepID=A0ABQ1CYD3_STRDI|nr:DUF6292 family protein [Streptomyces diastaticus]GFH75322.1 hypothetical protein Sdia_60900 [Streptomyces diastaticus subsp. diastaticus]GGU49940.1 hypothetical protein GCM10015534_59360 [Streptomyces diastaticus subsp. diastaticus]